MKPLLTILLVSLFGGNFIFSQDTMYIMKSGLIISKYATANVDSIIFYNPGNAHFGSRGYGSLVYSQITLTADSVNSAAPSIHQLSLLCSNSFTPDSLTNEGLAVYNDNGGGSSAVSEGLAMDILHTYVGGSLLIKGSEIQPSGSGYSFISDLYDQKVGIAVTRAMSYPRTDPFTVEQALSLLQNKLNKILAVQADITPEQKPVKGLIVVFTHSQSNLDNIKTAISQIDPSIMGNTIILLVLTEGEDNFIYS